jgi:APA family basic amino acid/polyamine antiporter
MSVDSRKTLQACAEEAFPTDGSGLRRSLGIVGLTAFGVGSTIGAGVFSLTGEVAAHQAGPAVSLAFVLASVCCFFAGLCYAEFAAMAPISGSAYTYAYVSFGERVAWLVGWTLILEWLFSASVVAISWSSYTLSTLGEYGIALPATLTQAPLTLDDHGNWIRTAGYVNCPAIAVVVVCTVLLLVGTRTSSVINTVIVSAKVVALLILTAVGAKYIRTENWHPLVPANAGSFGHFGWSGVVRGAGILFFAYLGFDGVSTLAGDARNPQRTVPWSLFASLLICTVLYVSVSVVVTGLADYRSLDVPDPLYLALSADNGQILFVRHLISFVAVVGLFSVILTCILGQVRIFYSMARDGLLPAAMARVGRANGTPFVATLVTGFFSCLIAGLLPLDVLGELASIGTLLAFATVCAGVLILRRTAPNAHRPFRTPWVPLIPILGILSCVALMLSLPVQSWLRLVVWLVVGALIYVLYGRTHSKVGRRTEAGDAN